MVVSSILSLWVEFHRSVRCAAALAPLARTHIVIVSAKAVWDRPAEPAMRAISAAQCVRLFISFLPAIYANILLFGKKLFSASMRKAFPILRSAKKAL